ncbi:Rieske 2Fe-2S domain-containing protein [Spirillospora sp. CA-294931]|uniref:Rieske 2Fe-2S domain-containing protein n=1 Tax=Spirillospora sp. CA-294931 TaxID=3240042 RepID=UPI003D920946
MNRRASRLFRRGSRPPVRPHPVDLAERLEHAQGLDRTIRTISTGVQRVLRPGPVKDALHGVPAGHPAHPPLTDLPVGCWVSAAVLDLIPGTGRASQALVAAGLAGAVPTALTGLADWSALHREQQRVGLVHAMGTLSASAFYTASLVARHRGRDGAGRALGFAGLTALLAGGFLGGHLAFRQGAGASHADQVAHLVPLGWHDLCEASELPDGWPVHRRLGYIGLFVLRTGDDIHVLADRCSHLAGPLHQGRITTDDNADPCVVCPWHGSTFRVRDGAVVHGPATGRQPAFESRVTDDGTVQVRPIA